MGTIAKVSAGGSTHLIASTCYGTCPTEANAKAKVATIQDSQEFALLTGTTIHIKFTNSNTASGPTLNVNSTGAKNIYKYGTTSPGATAATSWQAGSVLSFTYDGTSWIMNDHLDDTNTQTVTGVKGNSESSYRTGNVNLTAAHIGAIATTAKGVAGGVAELDANGLVPTSQLPSYVDDVLEYASASAFPATGEAGKIYVALDTNLTYRWGGTEYVEISPSLALGETSSTAYRGDRGKIAYDHSQATGNPHGTSISTNTTGITISDHSTSSITGVKSTTTTASKVTLGTALSVPNVISAGSGSFTSGAFFGGSGSFTATVTDGVLSFSHTHVAATHDADTHTHTAPTLGTAISVPNVTSVADVTVPIKNDSATTVVTGKTHTVTDNGHTHTLS